MSDKSKTQKAHEQGQRDGAEYAKQGGIERGANPKYDYKSSEGKEVREAYDKGHRNGRGDR